MLQLTEQERNIIASTELAAHASISELRQETRNREHVIRYAIHKYEQAGILLPNVVVNSHIMGVRQFNVYCSLDRPNRAQSEAFMRHLTQSEEVNWACSFIGETEFNFSVCVLDPIELYDFLNDLQVKFSGQIVDLDILLFSGLHEFGIGKFLTGKARKKKIYFGRSSDVAEIDSLDHKILHTLTAHPTDLPAQQARRLGISNSSLQYRITRLERDKILVGYRYLLNTNALGFITYVVLVSTRATSDKTIPQFISFAAEHLNICYVVTWAGAYDFKVGIVVSSVEQVTGVLQDIRDSLGQQCEKIKVLQMHRLLKAVNYPFKSKYPTSSGHAWCKA